MRAILAFTLVSYCSVGWAEPIEITGVIANYVTARDEVDFEISFSRPLDSEREWISLWGGFPIPDLRPQFTIHNHTAGLIQFAEPTDTFTLLSYRKPFGSMIELVQTSDIVPAWSDDMLSFSLPAGALRLREISSEKTFDYSVVAFELGGHATTRVNGYSTVDDPRNTAVPEPRSAALASFSILALLVHLVRRPGFRERWAKRHVGREPIVPRAAVRNA